MSIATSGAPECKPAALAASPASAGFARSTRRDAHYFILQTHLNCERSARDALQAPYRGCTVYLPLELVTVVHARRRKEVARAFLPRYLFVLDEGQGGPVMRTCPGVSHVVKCGEAPAMIAQEFINRIKARETDGYVDLSPRFTQSTIDFVPGERLRVTDGPFASFDAIFVEGLDRRFRAKVLVQIFGRENEIELEPWQFERR